MHKGARLIPAGAAYVLFGALVIFSSCATPPFSENEWRERHARCGPGLVFAPHEEKGRFFNPWMRMEEKSAGDMLRWKLSARAAFTEEEKNFLPELVRGAAGRLREEPSRDLILWIGHASFLVRLNGEYWLMDPVVSEDLFLLKRRLAPGLSAADLRALPGRLSILISHNHYDHMDDDFIKSLPADTRVFVPLGLGDFVRAMGIRNVREMDWWQELDAGGGVTLACLPAQHWSRRVTQDTDTSLWAGYLIKTNTQSIYFCGDSGMFVGFGEIARRYPGIGYALLPVGPGVPRWLMHYQHLDPDEALDAFDALGARFMVPMHWGTFTLGDEPAGAAGLMLRRRMRERNVDASRVRFMDAGGIISLDAPRE